MKAILEKSGFDSPEHLRGITESQLNQLENYINQKRMILENIEIQCSHIQFYKQSQNFEFLPGHRLLIDKVSQSPPNVDQYLTFEHPAISTLMQKMIQTALNNYNKAPEGNRYPNLLMDFAVYIFIMAGKACYEVIASNLPFPSTIAISNYILNFRPDSHTILI